MYGFALSCVAEILIFVILYDCLHNLLIKSYVQNTESYMQFAPCKFTSGFGNPVLQVLQF